jgi:hypothetical protein
MALRYAVATGNWSSTSIWDGGTLPQAGDEVYANGFIVAINQDIIVNKISTKAASPAIAGGGFTIAATVTRNLICNIEAGTTTCVTINDSSPQSATIITGNIYGGNTSNAIGVSLNVTGGGLSTSPVIYGNIYGGVASGTHGLAGRFDRGYQPTIYGNIEAGIGGYGILLSTNPGQPNALIVYGNIKGNGVEGILTTKATCFGTIEASSTTYGIRTITDCYVSGIMLNTAGYWAVSTPRIFVNQSQSIQMRLNELTTNNGITLYSSNSFVGIPSGSDVRKGVVYGVANSLTGSLAVPPTGSVALGVPVDNGVGTAMISVQDMGTLLASYVV